jgi:hypothetical protein
MEDETEGTEPQLADDLDEADPEEAERLVRGSWPATDEELAERTGEEADDGSAEPEVGGG